LCDDPLAHHREISGSYGAIFTFGITLAAPKPDTGSMQTAEVDKSAE